MSYYCSSSCYRKAKLCYHTSIWGELFIDMVWGVLTAPRKIKLIYSSCQRIGVVSAWSTRQWNVKPSWSMRTPGAISHGSLTRLNSVTVIICTLSRGVYLNGSYTIIVWDNQSLLNLCSYRRSFVSWPFLTLNSPRNFRDEIAVLVVTFSHVQ